MNVDRERGGARSGKPDSARPAGRGANSTRRGARPALSLLAAEVRVEARSGLYAAYAVLTGVFVLLLVSVPSVHRERVFELIVLLDPSMMGFFFAGGLVLLERDQGILSVVMTRGRGFSAWWRAKAAAICGLAVLVVAVIAGLSQATEMVDLTLRGTLLLAAGLGLTVPLFLSLGIAMAGLFPRVLDYFLYSSILMTPLMFPLVELLGIRVGPAGIVSPVWGGMVLVTSVFEPARSGLEIVLAFVTLGVWNILAYRWAMHGFESLAGVGRARPGLHGARRVRPYLHGARRVRPARVRRAGGGVAIAKAPFGRAAGARAAVAPASVGPSRVRVRPSAGAPTSVRPDPAPSRAREFGARLSAAGADLRLMLREPATSAILFAPLLVAVILGRGLPWLLAPEGPLLSPGGSIAGWAQSASLSLEPVAGVIRAHMDYVRSFVIVLGAIMYGMLGGLLFLDEKDAGVLPFLKTLPGPPGWYLLRRCRRLLIMYALILGPVVAAGGLYHGTRGVFVLSLALDALALPVFFLIMGVVAKTKVQGLALAKVLNIFVLAPLLVAVLPGRWAWAAGVLPTGWGTLLRLQASGAAETAATLLGAALVSGTLLVVCYRRARGIGAEQGQ